MNQVTIKGVTYEYDPYSECSLAKTTEDDIVIDYDTSKNLPHAIMLLDKAMVQIQRKRERASQDVYLMWIEHYVEGALDALKDLRRAE
jgi:hypothetical protein